MVTKGGIRDQIERFTARAYMSRLYCIYDQSSSLLYANHHTETRSSTRFPRWRHGTCDVMSRVNSGP